MDSTKTGLFIADRRKQKNWTQAELGEKIGVTDKAISRWETGRGFPDISLLRPLSKALGVSVNEILAGEIIAAEHTRESADDALIQTLTYSKQKISRIITGILFAVGGFLLICSLLFLGYDTSWVSVYSIIGVIIIACAVFRILHKNRVKAILAILGLFLLAGMSFEARDYIWVTYYSMPPLYNLSILTSFSADNEDKVIKYEKLFYVVYRYHVDQPDEYYVIRQV